MNRTREIDSFKNRLITRDLSPAFLDEHVQVEDTQQAVELAAQMLEDNYNVVATVMETDRGFRAQGYQIKVIAANRADLTEVERGLQSVHHWLGNYHEYLAEDDD